MKKIESDWGDIAGYEDVKEELKAVISPYINPKEMSEMQKNKIDPIKGLLLFGPPGSGKTMFVKTLAGVSKLPIISVAGAEFQSKWVGESDQNLRNIFERAKQSAPCIIFFDELEAFLPKRELAQNVWEKTLVTTFLSQIDGFDKLDNVLVIGATNYPEQIDAAAIRPGRFDKCIYIKEPDVPAKIAILKHYLGETTELPEKELERIAFKLERYTAADIAGLIKELYRQNQYKALTTSDIINASKQYKPTITLDMRDHYEKIANEYNRRFVNEENKENKVKKYTWNDVAGMEDVKKQMKKYVQKPLLYADKYAEIGLDIPKGILMFGPPGCGKTLFAKVIASECNASFFTINGPELLTGRIGESEEKLRRQFRMAREQKPSIIFFDEFDSIAENRAKSNSSVKIINQLLTELDGMEELQGVIVLAATNRLEEIDPALKRPGRFDNIIYVGLPDENSRKSQFELYLKDFPNIDYEMLAKMTDKFTCADINGCCRKIKELKLDMLISEEDGPLTQEDCVNVVKKFNRTLTDNEIEYYEIQKSLERN